jgi:hypothetical protein
LDNNGIPLRASKLIWQKMTIWETKETRQRPSEKGQIRKGEHRYKRSTYGRMEEPL